MNQPTAKTYWAFISYSSLDAKWGKWLHKRLENYSIPEEFQGLKLEDGTTIGKNLRPVFRDRDELAGSAELGAVIEEALSQSRFLIVLCSPNSAKSKWVNKEIEDFRSIHGDGKVLALIVDGEPNATANPEFDDALECFPPSLRYPLEPLAGDLRPEADGKERGFLKILAGIADIGFDDLYRRHERAQRKRRLLLATIATAIIAALAGLSGFAFNQKSIAEAQTIISNEQTEKANEKTIIANQQTELARKKTRETERALTQVENVVDSLTQTYDDLDIKEVRKGGEPLEAILASRLLDTSRKITNETIDDQELVANIRNRLGRSLLSLGYPKEAAELIQESLRSTVEQHSPSSPQTIQLTHNLAIAQAMSGNPEEAIRLHQTVLKYRQEHLGDKHRDTLGTKQGIAEGFAAVGKLKEAHQAYLDLYQTCVAEFGEFDPLSVAATNNLATSHSTLGNNSTGIELLKKTVPAVEERNGPENIDTLSLKNNLGILYSRQGNFIEAKKTLTQVLNSKRRALGESHPDTILTMSSLGSICLRLHELTTAQELIEESWQHCLNRLAESNITRIQCATNLAALEQYTGKTEKAMERVRGIVKVYEKHFAGNQALVIGVQNNLASMLLSEKKKSEEAEHILKVAMASADANLGDGHPLKMALRINMAQVIAYNDQPEAALQYGEETLRLCQDNLTELHPTTLEARNLMALLLALNNKFEEAKQLLEQTIGALEDRFGRKHPATLNAIANLGVIYRDLGDDQKSVDLLSEVAYSETQHPSLAWARDQLGESQMKLGPGVGLKRLVTNELAKSRAKHPANSEALAKDLLVSSNALIQINDLEGADPLLREALQIYETIDKDSWLTLYSKGKLGELLRLQKNFVDAERVLKETVDEMFERRKEADDAKRKQYNEINRNLFYVYSQTDQKEKIEEWKKRRGDWYRK